MTQQSAEEQAARPFPNWRRLLLNLVNAAAVAPLGLFVFSLLGRYYYFAELVCNFRVQILIMLIPFIFVAVGTRRWILSGFLLIAIGWSMIGTIWVFLPGVQPDAGPTKLKIMSYNVLAPNTNHSEVAEQILDSEPDFVSILEYSLNWHQALDCLDEIYPYQVTVPRWHGFGIAIFSKYPISQTKVIQLTKQSTDNPLIVTNVAFGDQTIRIAALHVLSPTNRYRLDLRNQQFVEVANAVSNQEIPTMVMGDFNCTPWSPFLTDFARDTGYRDSRRGFGYQGTWPADQWITRIPIDHAFVSADIHVHSRLVGPRSGSDHLPIILEVSTAK